MTVDPPLPRPIASALKDRQLWLVLVGTVVVALLLWSLLPTGFARSLAGNGTALLSFLLLYPLVEEVLFRGVIQGELLGRAFWRRRHRGLSRANLVTSLLFVVMHMIHQPAGRALAVMIPSLVMGHFRERYDSLAPPVILHVLFNLAYLCAGLPGG
jgi:membrane protease YdiL (CAAX protease family)